MHTFIVLCLFHHGCITEASAPDIQHPSVGEKKMRRTHSVSTHGILRLLRHAVKKLWWNLWNMLCVHARYWHIKNIEYIDNKFKQKKINIHCSNILWKIYRPPNPNNHVTNLQRPKQEICYRIDLPVNLKRLAHWSADFVADIGSSGNPENRIAAKKSTVTLVTQRKGTRTAIRRVEFLEEQ